MRCLGKQSGILDVLKARPHDGDTASEARKSIAEDMWRRNRLSCQSQYHDRAAHERMGGGPSRIRPPIAHSEIS